MSSSASAIRCADQFASWRNQPQSILVQLPGRAKAIERRCRDAQPRQRKPRPSLAVHRAYVAGDVSARSPWQGQPPACHVLIIDDSSTVPVCARPADASGTVRVSEAATMEDTNFRPYRASCVDLVLRERLHAGHGWVEGHTLESRTGLVDLSMSAGMDSRSATPKRSGATRRIGADAQITKPFAAEDLVGSSSAVGQKRRRLRTATQIRTGAKRLAPLRRAACVAPSERRRSLRRKK